MNEQNEEKRYTYQEFLDKYFPNVGDLTKTCPHCGKRLDESPFKITKGSGLGYGWTTSGYNEHSLINTKPITRTDESE